MRVQRKRTKGWRMPENTVYVGRPTKWGNPWRHEDLYMSAYVPPIVDALRPSDTPAYMTEAWLGCLVWAINQPEILAWFHVSASKPCGVASELADVVIRVADMAEWYRWDLSGWEGAEISHPIVEPTFRDWISLIHGNLSLAFAFLCTELERRTWEDALKGVLRLVSDMAAHYGIDLDTAIEAKLEYNRIRPYRHGGKAL